MITDKDVDGKVKDVIYLESIKQSMIDGFNHGYKMGETSHFITIDEHFKWLPGNVILFAGIGNYGKSKMVRQLTLIRAIENGEKTAIFSPEDLPADYFYNDLIHTYIGKSPFKGHQNQMSMDEYQRAMEFVKNNFFLIYPENDASTPDYINARFEDAIREHGVKFCITDPFNQLDNDWETSGRDDRYVSEYLTKEKRFAIKHNVYKITVAHVNSRVRIGEDGNFEMPNVYNLAGGAMWNNKCDDICVVHRPVRITEPENTHVVFASLKIKKQILCGRPGNVDLVFDVKSNRYYEIVGDAESSPYKINQKNNPFDEIKPTDEVPF